LIHLDFDIVSDLDIRISDLCYINSTNSYVRIYKQIMQNKPNFRNDKMNITLGVTSEYVILSRLKGEKTKPIQTQFNPKQTQFNPISKPNKPNFDRSPKVSAFFLFCPAAMPSKRWRD